MGHHAKELHVISNGKMTLEQLSDILTEIHPYVSAIHLREKQKSARELFEGITLFAKKNIPLSKLIINDRVDVAFVTRAAGVQLAFHSLEPFAVRTNFPQLRIGCSVHSLEEGKNAAQNGADYVVYGHIFPSQSKPGLPHRGLEKLSELTKGLVIPVIAIGGIIPENTKEVISAGAGGIAVMSGILEAKDPVAAVKSYQSELNIGG